MKKTNFKLIYAVITLICAVTALVTVTIKRK